MLNAEWCSNTTDDHISHDLSNYKLRQSGTNDNPIEVKVWKESFIKRWGYWIKKIMGIKEPQLHLNDNLVTESSNPELSIFGINFWDSNLH